MKAIINGIILLPDSELRGKALLYDERIRGIVSNETALREADEILDAKGHYVSPGFIDTHTHGYGGVDVSDDRPEDVRHMAEGLIENGVTSLLPTTLTVAFPTLASICESIRVLAPESREPGFRGAEILGVHLEGPFINPEKKGAQNEEFILPPDPDKVLPYQDIVRVITLAPEMPGGLDCIRRLKAESNIAVSIGHTSAAFDQAMDAIGLGATRVTHLFNAMSGLHQRKPGVVGAALNSDVYAELICDTFHVDKGLFPMLAKLKKGRLVLITDALRSAGMPDGKYENGGQVFVLKGIECRLTDGTIAGSVLRMNQAVKNLRDFGCVPLYESVRAASLTPAESIGAAASKGSLTPGKDADIVIMDESCAVKTAIVRGVCKYQK